MAIRGLEGAPGNVLSATIVSVTAQVSQGTSSTLDASGYSGLFAVCTISTGTLATALRVWLQGSYDGGTNWYGLPMINVSKTLVHNLAFAELAGGVTATSLSLVSEAAVVTTTAVYVGTVNNPPPLVRAAWNIVGASATETFGITCLLSV